jgi:hypothetical protein
MGIDNSAKLVFGIIIDKDIFEKIVKKYMPEDYGDDAIEYFQSDYLDITQYYKGIYLGFTSPYYDIGCENWTYYIGIGNKEDESLSIEEITDLILSYKASDFQKLLSDNNIEDQEPALMAIVHVN